MKRCQRIIEIRLSYVCFWIFNKMLGPLWPMHIPRKSSWWGVGGRISLPLGEVKSKKQELEVRRKIYQGPHTPWGTRPRRITITATIASIATITTIQSIQVLNVIIVICYYIYKCIDFLSILYLAESPPSPPPLLWSLSMAVIMDPTATRIRRRLIMNNNSSNDSRGNFSNR